MLETLLLVQGEIVPPPVKGDITFKTSGTTATTITTSQLGTGFTTQYSVDGGDFTPTGTSFVIPAGDHEVTLKLDVTTGTTLDMEIFKNVLMEVTDWEGFQLPNIQFNNCFNLTKLPDRLPVSITDMTRMLYGCASFNHAIGGWDTSNVVTMERMFYNCTAFNQDIGSWNTSNVTRTYQMFYNSTSFNQDIGSWNTSNVTVMGRMFHNCTSFNQDISDWDVSQVTNISYMFNGCMSFNQDIGQWNVSNVTRMDGMFNGCTNFNKDISAWNVSKVTNMSQMFYNCTSFNQDLSSMVFKSSVTRTNYDTGATAWLTAYRPKFTG